MSNEKLDTDKVSEIDNAIKQAKARKAARAQGTQPATEGTPEEAKVAKPAKEPSEPKRPRLTEEQKNERQAARDKEREAKKLEREADRAKKKSERQASRQPAHMRKVMKAAEKLGTLGQAGTLLFNEATANLTAAELATLALHIQHFNRVKSTERALSQELEVGQAVQVIGGDPRFIGRTGNVVKAQRIRCYVDVGDKKPLYLFTSEVEVITAAEQAAAAS